MTVRLRPLRIEDRDQVREWRNRNHVRAMMYTDHEIGAEEHARWFERALTDPGKQYFVIEDHGRDCGLAGFTDIADGRASWAFYLADSETRGRGLGAQTEYLMLTYAFETLALRELRCEVFAFNAGVVAMHESFGFTRTGILPGRAIKDGAPQDVVTLSMFAGDWPVAKARARERLAQKGLQAVA